MSASRQQSSNGSGGGGCAALIGVLIVIGLAIKFWYVTLTVLVAAGVAFARHRSRQRALGRRRSGSRDAWLNEVAVALADLELTEWARNTGAHIGGVPIEGDLVLRSGDRTEIVVSCCADAQTAHDAEMALRARPDVRALLTRGAREIRAEGRIVFVAKVTWGAVDEFRLDEVVRVVRDIPVTSRMRRPVTGVPPAQAAR